MSKTIFQKIIDREIPAKIEHEDDLCIVLHDIQPQAPVHLLIIPKRHVERFEELRADELAAMMELIKKVDGAAKKVYGTTGSVILQKNGAEAGQSVPHVHFHYIPCERGGTKNALVAEAAGEPSRSPIM